MLTEGVTSESYGIRRPGSIRQYVMIRPVGVDPATLPAVVDLHGSGSWPEEHADITAARALAAAGAVVVIPEAGIPFRMVEVGPMGRAWNVPGSPLPGESDPRD